MSTVIDALSPGGTVGGMNCATCGCWMVFGKPHFCFGFRTHSHCWKDEVIEPEPSRGSAGARLFVQRCTDYLCNEVRMVCRLK